MSSKKPAQLSDTLLAARPRKGEAKPQTETAASNNARENIQPPSPAPSIPQPPVGRRRRSKNTIQLNLRITPESMDSFVKIADNEDLTYAETFNLLLASYKKAT